MSSPYGADAYFLKQAIAQAKKSADEGGVPIGAVLVVNGRIVSRGHNKRVQENSMIKHGETDCFENTLRGVAPEQLQRATLYTTLSPCFMCAGASMLFGIKRIVIGENETFEQSEEWLKSRGVEVLVLHDKTCVAMMRKFIGENPKLWGEDIGKTAEQILEMYGLKAKL